MGLIEKTLLIHGADMEMVQEAVLGRQLFVQQQEASVCGRMSVEQLEMWSERYRLGAGYWAGPQQPSKLSCPGRVQNRRLGWSRTHRIL